GSVVALHDVGFEVRPGELFGFVGSNGAGKTTTMRIVLGVLTPDSGEVIFDGEPITRAVRTRSGYMPEERGLYPKMKVADQLVYLAELHGMSSADAQAATQRWLARLDLSHRRQDEVQKLSLGNQQRVQLAAALVHEPDLLVLDEPFSGLHPVAVDVMSQVLREQAAGGVPVIFSSHQLDLIERLRDRVGIIANGRMVAVGSVEELTSSAETQLEIVAPEAEPGWANAVPGVTVVQERPPPTLLKLGAGADVQAVMPAALATGPVTGFTRHRPSLAELFRSVVADETGGRVDAGRSSSADRCPAGRPARAEHPPAYPRARAGARGDDPRPRGISPVAAVGLPLRR